jgi:hypothetical protein
VPGPIELLGGAVSVAGVVLINRARVGAGGPVPRRSREIPRLGELEQEHA